MATPEEADDRTSTASTKSPQAGMRAATKPATSSARKSAPKGGTTTARKKSAAAKGIGNAPTRKAAASAAEGVPPEVAVVLRELQPPAAHPGRRSAAEDRIIQASPVLAKLVSQLVQDRDIARQALEQAATNKEEAQQAAARQLEEKDRQLSAAREEATDAAVQLAFDRGYFQPLSVQIVRITNGEAHHWTRTNSWGMNEMYRTEVRGIRFVISLVNGEAFLAVEFQVGRRHQTYTLVPDVGLRTVDVLALHHLLTATDDELCAELPEQTLWEVFTSAFLSRRRSRNVGFSGAGSRAGFAETVGRRAIAGSVGGGPLAGLQYRRSGSETPDE